MSATVVFRVLFCAIVVSLLGAQVSFAASKEKEVDYPKLPAGAGRIAKDAPKQFTQTASGLRYRILPRARAKCPRPRTR